ncbi:TonB-dependent receptor [Oleiagrimonas citrea]|uniref:TonB-dependent receptor n=2 Tax=Oleiagrimonas citrea TaxID=1665687 RepID=A0A846ZRZ7_9GAMM|nr:TonB-dependent receptor [Oleiagrimonas citrea]
MISRTTTRPTYMRRTALAVALGMCVASGGALAQSSATGIIFGQVQGGQGSTVQIQNTDTGQTRTLSVDADGRYRASSLPIGRYNVTLMRDGKVISSRDNVQVSISTGTDVSFTSAANTTSLEGVQVVASALPAIDVSNVDSRTVLTAQELQKVPLGQTVNAASLLAPGTVAGDSRYGNVVSFGGASAAENQYYVNGFPVTNALTGLGFTELPFDAIDQQQVITGGLGAEYGRSTGGVVNIVTKSGGNTWRFGATVDWAPRALSDSPRDIYYPRNGNGKDGQLYQDRSGNKTWATRYGAYISGPLIKDRLFLYATAEKRETSGSRGIGSELAGTAAKTDTKTTRWLAKINWNITDSNLFEFTALGDTTKTNRTVYSYDYSTMTEGPLLGTEYLKNYDILGAGASPGGSMYIAKYTGYLTDNLTVTANYGKTKSKHVDTPLGATGVPCPLVVDLRSDPNTINGCGITGGTVLSPGAEDNTDGWRLDVEYQLGDHHLRAGLDNLNLKSYSGLQYEGGVYYLYQDTADVNLTGYPNANLPANPPPYLVRQRIIDFSANVKVEQEAQYIEDHWQINDKWLAYIGLRNEQFSNFNGSGQIYVKQRHQLAPRLGLTWDVYGDSSLKVYANAGRNHLAIPSNVAIRGASASLFQGQYFTYTGVDPATGVPSGLSPVTGILYSNGADGVTAPDPRSVAAKGLKAYYQDEFILGFDKTLGADWTFGAKATYRNLKSIIDDFCDEAPFAAYAARNNIDAQALGISAALGPNCYLFNPGQANTFSVQYGDGSYHDWTLTNADFAGNSNGVGFPKLKRKYLAVNIYLTHQFSDNWFGKAEYVWSKSYGNSEGLLKSDIGQLDPSVTQDWDFPELMIGSSGYLPNDRRHQLKAYGYWQMTPEWLFGANVAIASGRPKNCIGNAPGTLDRQGYGTSFFFCDLNHDGTPEATPRGSQGRLPWTYRLDLSAQWRPAWADHNLAFTADIFNVFTQQRTLSIVETNGGNPSYGRTISYQTPRYVRLGVRYDFSL